MHVERQYRELEKIEEIRVYNIERDKVFHPSEPVKKLDNVRFSNVMKHVPSDINVFQPMDDGDFLVERIGWNLLERLNLKLEDVEGRRFSEASLKVGDSVKLPRFTVTSLKISLMKSLKPEKQK